VVAAAAGGVVFTESNTPGFESLFQSDTAVGNGSSSGGDQTVQGDPINYTYGTIQVEVVKSGGKITAVNMLKADASAGRDQAFPYLQQYAIDAQGSSFGNLSGATATSEAFKQALDSALSKLH
jgi:uncharacterized protein with FMN-binding domain